MCAFVLSHFSGVRLFVTLWTVACQAPLSMGSPGKNIWVGFHALLQGIFPTQGSNKCLLHLLHCRWILYCWATGEAQYIHYLYRCLVAESCPTLCDPMDYSMPGFPVLHYLRSLLKLMSIELVMPFSHLILCRPLLLLPSVFPSIRVFSNESAFCIW